MKKIPYGIIDFKKLITGGYEYVDKTMYLEKLETFGNPVICLRPGRFGKSLFTSMLFYYYDINSSELFETLYKDTYVFDHPTPNKNNYYILKFDFSGIGSEDHNVQMIREKFKTCVVTGIENFINYYKFEYTVDRSYEPDDILKYFFSYFMGLDLDKKLYIIIDEYDSFTNAILEGDAKDFIGVVGDAGFVKSFYANIKIYVKEGIVDRVFMTGICPVTLNAMTTGFNIATDISTDPRFNSMIGLTHDEVLKLLEEVEEPKKCELYNLMIENYDGYLFSSESDTRVFNATLAMYFLNQYSISNDIPKQLYDNNIVANYGKIDNLLKLQNNSFYKELIDEILKTDKITGALKTQFNLLEGFTREDIISLLYYFGYLTINKDSVGNLIEFRIPNEIMKITYSNYFLKLLNDIDIKIDSSKIIDCILEIRDKGSIENITSYIEEILDKSSNRIFMKFDEKHIQLLYFSLLMNIKEFKVHTEYECLGGGYIDVFYEGNPEYTPYNIIVELKYIKEVEKNKKKLIEEKRIEGIEQLKKYSVEKDNLKKYLVIFSGRKLALLEEIDK